LYTPHRHRVYTTARQGYAEIARLMGLMTRAQVTQTCVLALLTPAVQERLLVEPAALASRSERRLRAVAAAVLWSEQEVV